MFVALSSAGAFESATARDERGEVASQRGHRQDGHTAGRAAETAGEGGETPPHAQHTLSVYALNINKASVRTPGCFNSRFSTVGLKNVTVQAHI